jgi:hypothetical protein
LNGLSKARPLMPPTRLIVPVGGALILALVRTLICALMAIPAIILITGRMGAARGSRKNTTGRASPDRDEQQCRRYTFHFITRCRHAGLTMGTVNSSRAIVSKKRAKRVVMISEMSSRVCVAKVRRGRPTQVHPYGAREVGFSRQAMQCREQAAFFDVLGFLTVSNIQCNPRSGAVFEGHDTTANSGRVG